MKKTIVLIALCAVCVLFQGCYAFLKADKLVYAGTFAKAPVSVVVDSAYNVSAEGYLE